MAPWPRHAAKVFSVSPTRPAPGTILRARDAKGVPGGCSIWSGTLSRLARARRCRELARCLLGTLRRQTSEHRPACGRHHSEGMGMRVQTRRGSPAVERSESTERSMEWNQGGWVQTALAVLLFLSALLNVVALSGPM